MTLLDYLAAATLGRSDVGVSVRRMVEGLGISEHRVRFARKKLEEEGLVVPHPRYTEDGGRLSNGYEITKAGRERLRKWRRSLFCHTPEP